MKKRHRFLLACLQYFADKIIIKEVLKSET